METILEIPEVAALDARRAMIRIPPEVDVPLTPRVRQIIDTADFRRLARISQLGLVSLVYPAAMHTRFEHCLGVYRLALLYLKQLAHDERFAAAIRPEDGRGVHRRRAAARPGPLAVLPSDRRHPTCRACPATSCSPTAFCLEGEMGDVLRHDWGINPRDVVALLSEKPRDADGRILASMLSGPIDIDKMDYLFRDSLHAGVPYGRHFDQQRLLGSLCLNRAGDGLAITDKGKTAAELMVFARYVMFSEVYWHHGVRAATAMLQRAFYLLHGALDLDALFRMTEQEFIDELQRAAGGGPAGEMLAGPVRPHAAALQAAGPIQLYRAAASFTSGWPGGRIPGWRPAPSSWPRWPARHWAGWWRRTKSSSTPRRMAREVQFDVEIYFRQGGPLPPAGRGLAGDPHAGHRAVRRLREAGAHLRPSPPDRRPAAVENFSRAG